MSPCGFCFLPFVHPGLAGAALVTALSPVIIHLISRRRHARMPWAAMAFLLAANRRSARRMRMEHWLLMFLRVAVVLLLGAAVARPYIPASGFFPSSMSRAHRILVLDNSLSMRSHYDGEATRFDAAKTAATRLVSELPPGDAVSLVLLSAPAEATIAHAAFDRRWVRESLASVQPSQRTTDVVGGIEVVRRILKDSPAAEGNRVVYLISDFARRDWISPASDQSSEAARAVRELAASLGEKKESLILVRVEEQNPNNIAVTRLETENSLVGVDVPIRVLAEVTNHGTSTARDVTLQLRRDGLILRREALPSLGPGASTTAAITVEFPTPGTHAIDARITCGLRDALTDDDARFLSVEAVEQRRILLVDGRPAARSLEGQAGFIALALAPSVNDMASPAAGHPVSGFVFAPTVIAETELENQVLDRFDAVGLANVARLSPAGWARLESYVAHGGGLLIALGDLVSADSYNRFGYANGRGLVPGRLGRVVEVSSGDSASPWKLDAHAHAIVTEFAGEPNSGLFHARVDRYVLLEPDMRSAEVALRYSDGAPALVASRFGKGNVLTWTTSPNMAWTNLPAKGDFVALVHNMFSALSPRRGLHRNITVGESLREVLAPAETSMTLLVRTDDGESHEPSLESEGDTLALVYGPAERAQFVTLGVGTQTRVAAVNVDPVESEIASASESELDRAVGSAATLISDQSLADRPPRAAQSAELGSTALFALIALLLCELWAAMRFSAPREREGSKFESLRPGPNKAVSRA